MGQTVNYSLVMLIAKQAQPTTTRRGEEDEEVVDSERL